MIGLHRQGRTIVTATHDVEAVMAYADRLLIMADGRVVRDGNPHDLVHDLESYGVRAPGRCHFPLETV